MKELHKSEQYLFDGHNVQQLRKKRDKYAGQIGKINTDFIP